MIKLSNYVAKFIVSYKVKNVFLLPGGGCMHRVDSLGCCPDAQKICCLHEQAAVIAADAYSQYTSGIGIALVTTGPGGTNAITGVAGSWIALILLMVFSGQAKRQDMISSSGLRQKGIQEVDIVSMVKSITKYAVTIMEPESIKYHLEKAYYLAKTERLGSVWIDILLDMQGAIIDESKLLGFVPPEKINVLSNIDIFIEQILDLLNSSKRPVLLVGNEVRLAQVGYYYEKMARGAKK